MKKVNLSKTVRGGMMKKILGLTGAFSYGGDRVTYWLDTTNKYFNVPVRITAVEFGYIHGSEETCDFIGCGCDIFTYAFMDGINPFINRTVESNLRKILTDEVESITRRSYDEITPMEEETVDLICETLISEVKKKAQKLLKNTNKNSYVVPIEEGISLIVETGVWG